MSIQKKVVLAEFLKLAFGVYLVVGILIGWIDYVAAGRIIGVGGLMVSVLMILRSATENEHGNILLRLRGEDRKIPTTIKHRVLTLSLSMVVFLGSCVMLLIGINGTI